MNHQYKVQNGQKLSKSQLRSLVQIDNRIPAKHDPFFENDKKAHKFRVEYFLKLTNRDFFKVVFEEKDIIAFHVIKKISPTWAYVSTLWVKPSKRKFGIAKELKQEGLKWAKKIGLKYIQTSVNVTNKRMLAINRRNGFKDFSVIMRLKL